MILAKTKNIYKATQLVSKVQSASHSSYDSNLCEASRKQIYKSTKKIITELQCGKALLFNIIPSRIRKKTQIEIPCSYHFRWKSTK